MAQFQPPVQVGAIYELDIAGLSHEGDGVGRYQGFTVFVKGALPNERVLARITDVQKRFAHATMENLIEPSKDRIQPICEVYDQCGGCQLQHLSYQGQLAYKEQHVKDVLQRIGHLDLDSIRIHPIIGMKQPWRYRNKAQAPVAQQSVSTSNVEYISQEIETGNSLSKIRNIAEKSETMSKLSKSAEERDIHSNQNDDGLVAGFYAANSHQVVDIDKCHIQHQSNEEIIRSVKGILRELQIPAYNRSKRTGIVQHIIAKVAFATGDTMIVLVTKTKELPKQKAFIDLVRQRIPHTVSIMLNYHPEHTSKVMGKQSFCIWGKEEIYDQIGDIRFAISADSFYQVNPVQTQVLYGKALEYAELTGSEIVIDAYCGVGTISLFLAKSIKHVYGIEIIDQAIQDARKNAKMNQIENTTFITGKAEVEIPKLYRSGVAADVIVVDPPRKGCDEKLLATIAEMKPKRVVYVSCDPSTLARDLRYLEDHGYKTMEVQPVDMFPHTAHVEAISSIVLKK
ncbi:23S rRNA (uracil(1939)-C(5))-methyltransferase RlmD [Fodinisporobacter ferrooxydans]|uniref:23S rRNA (Uracil(1939)-C(5))-methyltransferase RlmD n=1 Tax=Fodinisporobacter ferrooxydans TaxID=2901836 RepID=A0ABY4CSP2_9BACL|nr:23S rRNA (uracil(1939)-C(5))-methyltransferase RlmD [Alicyclobacillaceae bacterium MYW30-H2]